MKINEVKTFDNVKVEKYLPFLQKKVLVDDILKRIIGTDENGIARIDYSSFDFFYDYELIKNYTDVELDIDISVDDMIKYYDYFSENGIIQYIKDEIGDDFIYLSGLINKELQQEIDTNNSLVNVLSGFLNKALAKIPDDKTMKKIISDISKMANKIKPENLEIIKSAFSGKKE